MGYSFLLSAPFSARAITDVVLIQLDDAVLDRLFQTRPALCRRFLYSWRLTWSAPSSGSSS